MCIRDRLYVGLSTLSVAPNAIVAAASTDPIHLWLHRKKSSHVTNTPFWPTGSISTRFNFGTSVGSIYAERVFSYSGLVTTGRRNRTAKNLDRRAFLRH